MRHTKNDIFLAFSVVFSIVYSSFLAHWHAESRIDKNQRGFGSGSILSFCTQNDEKISSRATTMCPSRVERGRFKGMGVGV